jgi:hypothetical protein
MQVIEISGNQKAWESHRGQHCLHPGIAAIFLMRTNQEDRVRAISIRKTAGSDVRKTATNLS